MKFNIQKISQKPLFKKLLMEKLIAYVLLVIAQILSNDGHSNVSRQVCTLDLHIEINPATTCDDDVIMEREQLKTFYLDSFN